MATGPGTKEPAQDAANAANPGNMADRLRVLIRDCKAIPDQVREAEFTRIDEHVIDESLIRHFTENIGTHEADSALTATLKRRIEALTPYVGHTLVCVLIRLPGVSYTFEIDPADECIVHWEWQAA